MNQRRPEDEGRSHEAFAAAAARSHIIERPRLLKKLDEAPGRLILLVAPAGYGKTTLARAWSANRPVAWFSASRIDRDIAALAIGISTACEHFVPECARRLRERLSAARSPAEDAREMGELLAEDIGEWPSRAWIVIDDHHQVAEVDGADAFLSTLVDSSTIQMLVAARVRPSWVTRRRVVYGEAVELDQTTLAMNENEARRVLRGVQPMRMGTLIESARGWPAVLGLAARVPEQGAAIRQLPSALYDFFAEELYATVPEETQRGLQMLALVHRLRMDELRDFMGTGFDNLVEVGTRVGFVEVNADRLEVHPLLRDFLEQQLRRTKFDSVVDSAVTALAAAEVWDEAFDVAVRFDSNKTLPKLVERAWQPLLEEGKLTTLARWISVIRTRHLTSDSVDLAEAQVALRQGRSQTAEFLALRVARTSTVANQKANAYSVAGSAAHIASKSRAFDHYAEALNLSSDLRITRQAKIGQFLSALEFQPERAQELFNGLENALDADPTTSLRLLAYRVMYERRTGNLRAAMALAEAGEGLLGQVDDPMARTAYLHSLAFGYSELASYDRARRTAVRLIDEGSKYRLPFAVSYGNFVFAIASLGLRQFKQGLTACEQAGSQARELGLAYGELNAKILMSRIRLAMGDWSRARALFDIDIKRSPLPALTAEFTMASAFLSAVIGDETRARRLLSRRAGLFLDGLVMSLRDATEAVIATRSSDHEKAANHLEHILGRGQLDTLVSTFRAEPETLVAVRHLKPWQDVLRKVLLEARESELGRRYGILESKDVNRLISRREMEVLGLLAQGLRNKEIGERLFISEVTVKAHLRRIFRVLGVSSRTQAVIASAGVLDQATPAADSANGEASDSDPN